jgi:hypothetical protein
MAEAIVFYSWQSDSPNSTNRGLIEQALTAAVKAVKADGSVAVEPVLDRDTQGVPGAPDIGQAIFDKIERAEVFVCDISFINLGHPDLRLTPNPNVLVELGYALRALSWERVVMVLNEATGAPNDLPFDLNRKRVVTYKSSESDVDRVPARKELAAKLTNALREIFKHREQRVAALPTLAEVARSELKAGGPRAAAAVQDYMGEFADRLAKANTKTQDATQLVQEIESLTPQVLEFIGLAKGVADGGEKNSALAMHRGFRAVLHQYDAHTPGWFTATDFDLPKFIGHESYVSFAAMLINRGHLGVLGEVLREPLTIPAEGNGVRAFSRLSAKVQLLGAYYEARGKQLRSPHGEMLKTRHTADSTLSRLVPLPLLAAADYFLHLYAGMHMDTVPWVPWSFIYMGGCPEWLSEAKSRRKLDELARVFGLNSDGFRTRYGELLPTTVRYFPGGFLDFDLPGPRFLGSIP